VDRKENNEWVLNKARVKGELLDTVKARMAVKAGHSGRMKKHVWRPLR